MKHTPGTFLKLQNHIYKLYCLKNAILEPANCWRLRSTRMQGREFWQPGARKTNSTLRMEVAGYSEMYTKLYGLTSQDTVLHILKVARASNSTQRTPCLNCDPSEFGCKYLLHVAVGSLANQLRRPTIKHTNILSMNSYQIIFCT